MVRTRSGPPQGAGGAARGAGPAARHASDVVHGRARERIRPRFDIMVQREDVHVVAARQPLDEPQQGRHDALASGGVDASRHHQADPHTNMIRTRTQTLTKDAKATQRAALRTATVAVAICIAIGSIVRAARTTLDIYFIDVEGGQSTLLVTPAGQSLLVDAGFPGDGTFASLPGDPSKARDAQRIVAAARDAGIARIDYLLLTHFHADHDGGIVELSQLMPIRTFIDHGAVPPIAEENEIGRASCRERV